MGRLEEAIAAEHLAVELDPLSAGLNARLGWKMGMMGDYDHAVEQLQKALELDPNDRFTNMMLAINYSRKGMYEEGLAICQKVVSLCENTPLSRACPSLILAMAGKTDEAQKILSELKGYRNLDAGSLITLAQTCCVMGEKTEAFEFLEVAYQQRGSALILLNVMPIFRNIRTDPRYADLLRRMQLPQVPLRHPEAS
jgi:tetratricopeptide (TPR) repeat protein